MKKINVILIVLLMSITAFAQGNKTPLKRQAPKKQDVTPFIKQLALFKEAWAKTSKEKGKSYTLKSTLSSMIGQTITFIDITEGKVVARQVEFDYRGGKAPENISEKDDFVNKSHSGTKAKIMEQYITDVEKMLSDYQEGKINGKLYFKAEGTTLLCLLTPYFVACHSGSGVRINSCKWQK